jgi:hypothetical protein
LFIMTPWIWALLAALAASPAVAHEWYPYECCSDNDCAPIPAGETPREMNGGFTLIDGRHVAYKAVRSAPDGRWHLCQPALPADTALRPILCIFGPTGGT